MYNFTINLWELGGQDQFEDQKETVLPGTHGVLFVFDLTRMETLSELDYYLSGIYQTIGQVSAVLVGNKADLPAQVSPETIESWKSQRGNIPYHPTIGTDLSSINEAINHLITYIRVVITQSGGDLPQQLKIVVVGADGVGKTTLIQSYQGLLSPVGPSEVEGEDEEGEPELLKFAESSQASLSVDVEFNRREKTKMVPPSPVSGPSVRSAPPSPSKLMGSPGGPPDGIRKGPPPPLPKSGGSPGGPPPGFTPQKMLSEADRAQEVYPVFTAEGEAGQATLDDSGPSVMAGMEKSEIEARAPTPPPTPAPTPAPPAKKSRAKDKKKGKKKDSSKREAAPKKMAESVAIEDKLAEETVLVERVLERKTTIFYHKQMNPLTRNKLSVILSSKKIYEELKQARVDAQRTASDKTLQIKETSPFVQVSPEFAGCVVTPAILTLDARKDSDTADFIVTPLATGPIPDACVKIYYEGVLIDTIQTPTKVVKQTVAKASALVAIAAPVLSSPLEDSYGVMLADFIPFYAQLGGLEGILLGLASALAVLGSVFFFLKRPRKAGPVEANFPEIDEIVEMAQYTELDDIWKSRRNRLVFG